MLSVVGLVFVFDSSMLMCLFCSVLCSGLSSVVSVVV